MVESVREGMGGRGENATTMRKGSPRTRKAESSCYSATDGSGGGSLL